MMIKLSMAAVAAALMMAATASAIAGQQTAAQTPEETSNALRIVCRRMPPPAGSRIGQRNVCKTQAQWDAEQAQYRQEVQRQQDLSHMGSPSG